MAKTFYSTSEIAGMLGVNRVTAYRWIKDGKIKAYGIGKHWKIPVSEVFRFFRASGFSEQQIRDFCGHDPVQKDKRIGKTVLLAGADAAIRESVGRLFLTTPGLQSVVMGTCADVFEAVLDIGKTAPDVVVWVVGDHDFHGSEIASKIKKFHEKTAVIFYHPGEPSSRSGGFQVEGRGNAVICGNMRGLEESLLQFLHVEPSR